MGTANINDSKSHKWKAKVDMVLEETLATKKQKIVIKSSTQNYNSVEIILDSQNYKISKSFERLRLI